MSLMKIIPSIQAFTISGIHTYPQPHVIAPASLSMANIINIKEQNNILEKQDREGIIF